MIDEKPTVPLSPPNSPRMSDAAAKTNHYQWQLPPTSSLDPSTAGQNLPQLLLQDTRAPGLHQDIRHPPDNATRPSLRSHKSFPYSLGPSSRLQHEVGQDASTGPVLVEFKERLMSQGPQPVGTSALPPATFGGSAPTSPAGRLTPHSPSAGHVDEQMDDDDDLEGEMGEQEDEEDKPPMTAAELRAQKRKMKRFRLTHNQTRFLMSEFARQAHPDAAHRERLSREIPGLSPRQVQVWFQNRRAKLKRLTTDDRERMMRSRALPADFDMTQALHSPFGAPPPNMGTPMPSPGTYGSYGDPSGVRPLTLDTLRRVPDFESYGQQYTSPTGITPALGSFAFTPPQSATDTMSPASAASNVSSFSFQTQESPRRHPFGLPMGAQSGYNAHHPHIPRLHLHDRFGRPMGESAGSPLRTSMSYSGLHHTNVSQSQHPERSSSFSEHSSSGHDRPQQHRSLTGPTGGTSGPYGLGFTYAPIPPYQSSEQQQSQQQTPTSTTAPSSSALPQYRRGSDHIAGPPISTYAQYQPSQFATPQMPQYSGFGGHFADQGFPNPFQHTPQHHASHQQTTPHVRQSGPNFTPVPSQPHHFVPLGSSSEHSAEEGDNSEGGVPLPPSY